MSDTASILRDVYGQYAAKKIARRFNVTVATAKVWLSGRFPERRTLELAAVVRHDLDIIDARNQKIREWLGIAGQECGPAEAGDEVAGRIDLGDAVAPGAEADLVGGEMTR